MEAMILAGKKFSEHLKEFKEKISPKSKKPKP